MPREVEFQGRRFRFPDDATDDDVLSFFGTLEGEGSRPAAPEPYPALSPERAAEVRGFMAGADGGQLRAVREAQEARDRQGLLAQAMLRYTELGGDADRFVAMSKEPGFEQRAAEFLQGLERNERSVAISKAGESRVRRYAGAALKGMTAGLVDPAAVGGEIDAGPGALNPVEYQRSTTSRADLFAEQALGMLGAATPIVGGTGALRAAGLGRAAAPASMAAYGAVQGAAAAPRGKKAEAALEGAVVMGTMGAIATPLSRFFGGGPAASFPRAVAAEAPANVVGGMVGRGMVGRDPADPWEMGADAVLGVATQLARAPEFYREFKRARAEGATRRAALEARRAEIQARVSNQKVQDTETVKINEEIERLRLDEELAEHAERMAQGISTRTLEEGEFQGRERPPLEDPLIPGLGRRTPRYDAPAEPAVPPQDAAGAPRMAQEAPEPAPAPGATPEAPAAPRAAREAAGPTGPLLMQPGVEAAIEASAPVATDVATRFANEFDTLIGSAGRGLGGRGRAVQQLAQRALDFSQDYRRHYQEGVEGAVRAVNGSRAAPYMKPGSVLVDEPGMRVEGSVLMDELEGRAPPISAEYHKGAREFLDSALARESAAGFLRDDGTPVPAQSKNAPRILHPEALDIIRSGKWEGMGWAEAYAKVPENAAAGWTVDDFTAYFREQQSRLNSDGPAASEISMASEHGREIPAVPGWINGRPVLEYNPVHYLTRALHGKAARFGWGYVAGQGPDSPVEGMLGGLDAKARDRVRNMLRSIHGAPVERPWVAPGDGLYPVVRAAQSAMGIVKSMLLSGNALINGIGELVAGPAAVQGRYRNTLRALLNMARDYKGVRGQLEGFGLKTREPIDQTVDPRRPIGSRVDKLSRNLRYAGSGWMEEIQETFAGEKARLETGKITAGMGRAASGAGKGPSETDLGLVRNFTDASADELAAIKDGTLPIERWAEVSRQMMRRFVSEAQGADASPAQASRYQHRRIVRALTAFNHYGLMMQRLAVKTAMNGAADIYQGAAAGDYARVGAGIKSMAKVMFGTAAATTMGTFAAGLLMGGTEKVESLADEAADRPLSFALDMMLRGFTAGPAGGLLKVMGDGSPESMLLPVHAGKELGNLFGWWNGNREYLGKDFWDRAKTYISRNAPAARMVTQGVVTQLWDEGPARRLKAARSRYYGYLRETGREFSGFARFGEFDAAMERLAKQVQIDGFTDPEALDAAIVEAAQHAKEGEKSVRASLLGKRLLSRQDLSDEEWAGLKARLLPEEFAALEAHDEALAALAEWIK